MSSKISALSAASALDLTEKYPIVQGGSTKGATGAQLQTALAATAAQSKDTTHTTHLLTPANLLDIKSPRVLFSLIGANMNSTADQQFTKIGTFTSWTALGGSLGRSTNASTSLTTAAGGIYSAASKGGDALMAASTTYAALTTAQAGGNLAATNLGCGIRTETPYLSLTTPQGGPATLDFYIWGFPFS